MIGTYLVLVELAKGRFYAAQPHPTRPPTTHEQRALLTIRRRAGRFIHHPVPGRRRSACPGTGCSTSPPRRRPAAARSTAGPPGTGSGTFRRPDPADSALGKVDDHRQVLGPPIAWHGGRVADHEDLDGVADAGPDVVGQGEQRLHA